MASVRSISMAKVKVLRGLLGLLGKTARRYLKQIYIMFFFVIKKKQRLLLGCAGSVVFHAEIRIGMPSSFSGRVYCDHFGVTYGYFFSH